MVATQTDHDHAEQRILLTQAETGMVLAQPVISSKRAVLCVRGTTLNDELIHRLMLLGIKRVIVHGSPAPTQHEPSGRAQLAMLEQRFSRVGDSALMNTIREHVRRHLQQGPDV